MLQCTNRYVLNSPRFLLFPYFWLKSGSYFVFRPVMEHDCYETEQRSALRHPAVWTTELNHHTYRRLKNVFLDTNSKKTFWLNNFLIEKFSYAHLRVRLWSISCNHVTVIISKHQIRSNIKLRSPVQTMLYVLFFLLTLLFSYNPHYT